MPIQEDTPHIDIASREPRDSGISDNEVRAQLRRILASLLFTRSERLSRFLAFIVEQTLDGHQDKLKEHQIGVMVCDRRESYDPRTDPVVRVEARRLRSALDSYYANEGRDDCIVVSVPKGGYAPSFARMAHLPVASRERKSAKRGWIALALVVAVILLALGYFLRERNKPRLTDKDTVVLADFVNTTGDSVFDDTLRHGLAAQLEQSPYLNLLSETRVAQTFTLMGLSKEARLTNDLARQICERTGGTATIEGSISSLGTQYVLRLKSINCHNGDVLAEELVSANGKDQVLTALGAASTSLRKQLGESLASVEKFDAPPENVTTPSLEALHAYSLGFKVHVVSLDEAGAAVLFRRAIALDPRFAMAYARLAICYANLGEFSRAADSASKAYELRNRASENERLFILSMYHEFVSGDLEATRQTYELRAQMYPHDDIPIGNLGNVYFSLGKYDKAMAATKKALQRNPGSRIWYGNLASSYIAANQLQQAKATIDEARSRQLDSPWLHLCLYLIDFQQRDDLGMEREAALLKDEPGFEDVSLYYQSQAAAYAGRLKESRTLTRRAVESARRADHIDSAAFYLAEAALRETLFGNSVLGKRQARESREISHSRDTEATAGITLALSGDSVQAIRLASELGKRFQEDTDVQSRYIPMIHAAAILGGSAPSKQYSEAIKALTVSVPYEYGSESIARVGFLTCYPIYFRGQAYLAQKQGLLAAAEFHKIIDKSQLTLTDPVGVLANLGLARAYAISEDQARSRAAYERFLTLWKNADPDLALLKQATAEVAKLPH